LIDLTMVEAAISSFGAEKKEDPLLIRASFHTPS
jgi:hypothetical protein